MISGHLTSDDFLLCTTTHFLVKPTASFFAEAGLSSFATIWRFWVFSAAPGLFLGSRCCWDLSTSHWLERVDSAKLKFFEQAHILSWSNPSSTIKWRWYYKKTKNKNFWPFYKKFEPNKVGNFENDSASIFATRKKLLTKVFDLVQKVDLENWS